VSIEKPRLGDALTTEPPVDVDLVMIIAAAVVDIDGIVVAIASKLLWLSFSKAVVVDVEQVLSNAKVQHTCDVVRAG